MPNHKSAVKRARQNVERRDRNRAAKSSLRTEIKKLRTAIEGKDADAAKAALPEAIRALSRAGGKGIIHAKQASRKIGRLTKAVHGMTTAE